MESDSLIILIVSFGLFLIFVLILFYIYAKGKYNSRHLDDDYKKEIDLEDDDD